ncbi:MAG: hypothetical protein H7Y12_07205 [Sphingobacteriaceae bacterium]|nr:hypothetical protein [Cytophagaceae bacterium]
MKRSFPILLAVGLLSSLTLHASDGPGPKSRPKAEDSRLFLKVYGYYGLLSPGSYRLTSNTTSSMTGSSKNAFSQSKGIGLGPRAGIGIGYIVSDLINLGIDAEYSFATSIEAPSTFSSSGTGFSSTGQSNQTFTYEFATLTPNLTLKAITRANYYIYTRVGLSLILPLQFNRAYESTSSSTSAGKTTLSTSTYEYDYSGNLDLGFQAALGVQFSAGEKIRIFGEIVFNAYTFLPASATYTNTYSQTNPASTSNTAYEYTYQKSGEYTSAAGATSFTVQQERIQANSLGLAVGVAYRF